MKIAENLQGEDTKPVENLIQHLSIKNGTVMAQKSRVPEDKDEYVPDYQSRLYQKFTPQKSENDRKSPPVPAQSAPTAKNVSLFEVKDALDQKQKVYQNQNKEQKVHPKANTAATARPASKNDLHTAADTAGKTCPDAIFFNESDLSLNIKEIEYHLDQSGTSKNATGNANILLGQQETFVFSTQLRR